VPERKVDFFLSFQQVSGLSFTPLSDSRKDKNQIGMERDIFLSFTTSILRFGRTSILVIQKIVYSYFV
jgi:hypothetical protein